MPIILLSPIDKAFVKSVSVKVIAVVKAASGVIDKAPVAKRLILFAVITKSSPAASPEFMFKVRL